MPQILLCERDFTENDGQNGYVIVIYQRKANIRLEDMHILSFPSIGLYIIGWNGVELNTLFKLVELLESLKS